MRLQGRHCRHNLTLASSLREAHVVPGVTLSQHISFWTSSSVLCTLPAAVSPSDPGHPEQTCEHLLGLLLHPSTSLRVYSTSPTRSQLSPNPPLSTQHSLTPMAWSCATHRQSKLTLNTLHKTTCSKGCLRMSLTPLPPPQRSRRGKCSNIFMAFACSSRPVTLTWLQACIQH